jgi:hypothetical protein
MGKENFNVNLLFSQNPLAEARLEQVFQYVLNINNSFKPNEEQNTYLEENQGFEPSELVKAQKT